jgi:hypothetical protein
MHYWEAWEQDRQRSHGHSFPSAGDREQLISGPSWMGKAKCPFCTFFLKKLCRTSHVALGNPVCFGESSLLLVDSIWPEPGCPASILDRDAHHLPNPLCKGFTKILDYNQWPKRDDCYGMPFHKSMMQDEDTWCENGSRVFPWLVRMGGKKCCSSQDDDETGQR